ncbi:MAG: hypothetical protein U9P90_02135 [Patescibacteria group bacterium]|nr:hypothetical protein [Patescibacteria group bacterium]
MKKTVKKLTKLEKLEKCSVFAELPNVWETKKFKADALNLKIYLKDKNFGVTSELNKMSARDIKDLYSEGYRVYCYNAEYFFVKFDEEGDIDWETSLSIGYAEEDFEGKYFKVWDGKISSIIDDIKSTYAHCVSGSLGHRSGSTTIVVAGKELPVMSDDYEVICQNKNSDDNKLSSEKIAEFCNLILENGGYTVVDESSCSFPGDNSSPNEKISTYIHIGSKL